MQQTIKKNSHHQYNNTDTLPLHLATLSVPSLAVDVEPGHNMHSDAPYTSLQLPTEHSEHSGVPSADQDPG